ncbi:MAG: TIGR04255 family protein [Alphaproteobacteria bacterium]|nr:TIGR04255 family protein [Alphaproteobacteria bacterium]
MGKKMGNAPVVLVLAQVQFNPVLVLEKYIPTIQESFRKLGFPDFRKNPIQTFNLNVGDSHVVPVTSSIQYLFSDFEKGHAFVLLENALSYCVTEYDVFEEFSSQLLNGLKIVENAVNGIHYIDRVGVRYVDVICPDDDLSLYLTPSVMGLVGRMDGELVHSFSETVVRRGGVKTVSRAVMHSGAIGMPPDLQPLPVEISHRFGSLKRLHAILDCDGNIQTRVKCDPEKLKRDLFLIHNEIDRAFRLIVTQHALDKWR